jgi:hypothetical protein
MNEEINQQLDEANVGSADISDKQTPGLVIIQSSKTSFIQKSN